MGYHSKQDIYVNAVEAAKLLGIPVTVFRNLILRGQGPKSKIVNGINKFNKKELITWNLLKKPKG